MKPFNDLVRRAEREWSKRRDRLSDFPALAARLLSEFRYDWSLERLNRETARWMSRSRKLPEQVSLHNTFGQPPLTLFNNERLVVDLYFWVAADTSLHSHGFRGAFRVLHGTSLQETFDVRVSRRVSPGVARVDVGTPEATILEAGDVRAILPGEGLTHRVIHLDSPTVTLCVKTINEPLAQREHYPDGLAVDRHELAADVVKKLYYYDYLLRRNRDLAESFLREVIGSLSVVTRLTLRESLGALDLSEAAVRGCLRAIRRLHGTSEWFRRHAAPRSPHLKELHFAGCDSALGRLVAHLVNTTTDAKTVVALVSRVAGRVVSRRDIEAVFRSLLGFEFIFGCPLSPDDRATIRRLVVRPELRVPRHLDAFGQIRRMRSFLRMFPAAAPRP